MTKTMMITVAKGLGLDVNAKMLKAEIEAVLTEDMNTALEEDKSVETTKDFREFNTKQYESYKLQPQYRNLAHTINQENLIHSLETNYKVTVNTSRLVNRGQYSDKIAEIYAAIKSGKVQKRTDEEIKARLQNYTKEYAPKPATKAQLDKITSLEKETGIVVTEVIRCNKIASQIIVELLAAKTKQDMQKKNIEEQILTHKSGLAQFFKRIFTGKVALD